MKLTRNLKIFIAFNAITTGLLYWLTVLNDVGVETVKNADGTETISTSMPFVWMGILCVSWFVLYKTDSKRGSRSNLDFTYHCAMTAIVLLPFLVMLIAMPFTSNGFDPYIVIPFLALSVSLFVHWFFTRKNPKGIEAKKAFK